MSYAGSSDCQGSLNAINGAHVDRYFREGRIREIAEYCESDVVNTYRVWLRHELFQGRSSDTAFETSKSKLEEFIKARSATKPHLTDAINSPAAGSS